MPQTMKFQLGQLVVTRAALKVIEEAGQHSLEFIGRHVAGDWGDIDDEDKRANDQAVVTVGRLLSVYTTKTSVKIWVITEYNRSVTTVLLPSEY